MDIATLNTVITQLEKKVLHCEDMLRWAIEQNEDDYCDMWAAKKLQAIECMRAVETMLENEIAYREHTTATYQEAA